MGNLSRTEKKTWLNSERYIEGHWTMTVRSNLVLTTELSKLATLKGSFFTLYGGQFTFSTQLLTLNYLPYSPTDALPQFL